MNKVVYKKFWFLNPETRQPELVRASRRANNLWYLEDHKMTVSGSDLYTNLKECVNDSIHKLKDRVTQIDKSLGYAKPKKRVANLKPTKAPHLWIVE